jgi:hypothetical protein
MSNLAGSIVGLYGTIKFIMNLLEGKYEDYMKNRKHTLSLKEIQRRRIEIIEKNMSILPMDLKNETSQQTARELYYPSSSSIDTSIQYKDFYMNAIKPYNYIN